MLVSLPGWVGLVHPGSDGVEGRAGSCDVMIFPVLCHFYLCHIVCECRRWGDPEFLECCRVMTSTRSTQGQTGLHGTVTHDYSLNFRCYPVSALIPVKLVTYAPGEQIIVYLFDYLHLMAKWFNCRWDLLSIAVVENRSKCAIGSLLECMCCPGPGRRLQASMWSARDVCFRLANQRRPWNRMVRHARCPFLFGLDCRGDRSCLADRWWKIIVLRGLFGKVA